MNQEKEYCIYKHTAPNGKVYIGQTCKKPTERWANGFGYKHQMFYKAIQKYGWGKITHEILFEGLSKEEADKKEIELIAYYDSTNPEKGYNLAFGGVSTTGVKCSEETDWKYSCYTDAILRREKRTPYTEICIHISATILCVFGNDHMIG